jgi:hypothetical protein
MGDLINNFIPFLLAIAVGYAFKQVGIFETRDGQALSKVVINVTLPSASFVAILRADLGGGVLLLSVMGFAIPALSLIPARWIGQRFGLDARTMGVFLCNVSVTNLGFFLFPIFLEIYGFDGLARLAIYDIGNAFSAFLVSYGIAKYYGALAEGRDPERAFNWRALVLSPPLLAVVAALSVNALGWQPPAPVMTILETGATSNSLLVMLGLGIFIAPRLPRPALVASGVALKMGLGLALGLVGATLFGFSGLDRVVAIMAPAMPTGMTTLIYAVNEGLDAELGATLVSVQIIAGFVMVVVLTAALPAA